MTTRLEPTDVHGMTIKVGDHVILLKIDEELVRGLPVSEQQDIRRQVGRVLSVQAFNPSGNVELEFDGEDEISHSIWVNPASLKKTD